MKKEHVHKEQLGYKTPKGYIEHSKNEMLIFTEGQTEMQKTVMSNWRKSLLAVAATVILAIGGFSISLFDTPSDSFEQLTIESLDVSEDEFDQWFDENFVLNDV